jgi:hypothetical protein
MRFIKLYEQFRSGSNLSLLLEAVLNLDVNIQNALKSIKDDKTSDPTFAKLSELILNSIQKEFPKLKYDNVYLNPEKKKDFPLKGKIGKQETEQSVTRVINNVISSIYDNNKILPKYLIKKDGGNSNIPAPNTFLREDEYLQIMSKFSKEEIESNKKKNSQEKSKFIIDNLTGGAIIDEFSRILGVKLSESTVVSTDTIKLVSGGEILKWYNSDNTETAEHTTLANSCMRGDDKNNYMKLYSDNPEKIKLVIKLNSDGKLVARALVWKLDFSQGEFDYYMDRCYYNVEEDVEILFTWLRKQPGYQNSNRASNPENMIVKLEKVNFKYYPYVDTFKNLFIETKLVERANTPENLKLPNIPDWEKNSWFYQDIVLSNKGFLSNLTFAEILADKNLVSSLENIDIIIKDYYLRSNKEPIFAQTYLDFRLQSTLGERKANKENFKNFDIGPEVDVVTLKSKLNISPSTNYLVELDNLYKISKLAHRDGTPEDIFDIEKKQINDNYIRILGKYMISKDLTSDVKDWGGLEVINGCRLFFYNVKNKLGIKEVSDKLNPSEYSFYRYRNWNDSSLDYFVSALDLDILGILHHFKKMKPTYFSFSTAKEFLEKNSEFISESLEGQELTTSKKELLERRKLFVSDED